MCFSIRKCIKCWLRKTWCKNKKITNRSSLCPLTEMDWLTWYIWNTTRFTLEKFSYLAFVNVAITGQWNISPTLISREQFCFDNVVLKIKLLFIRLPTYKILRWWVENWKKGAISGRWGPRVTFTNANEIKGRSEGRF